MKKKIVLLKLTGTILIDPVTKSFTRVFIDKIIEQIKSLRSTYQFGIVIGGGNIFRGSRNNGELKLRNSIAHTVGMVGTTINGLILYDLFAQQQIPTSLFCSLDCPAAGQPISQPAIDKAIHEDNVLIFSGGTGNPSISTDTSAVIRAQQIGTHEIWKATDVDGVYSADPHTDTNAQLLKELHYQDIIKKNLHIMDQTAIILALEGNIKTRVFNSYDETALITASKDNNFGSTLIP